MVTLKPTHPAIYDAHSEVILPLGRCIVFTNDPSIQGPNYIFLEGMRYDRVELRVAVLSATEFVISSTGDSPILYSNPQDRQKPLFITMAINKQIRIAKPKVAYVAIPCFTQDNHMVLAYLHLAFSHHQPDSVCASLHMPSDTLVSV